jgi:hypothetical protein
VLELLGPLTLSIDPWIEPLLGAAAPRAGNSDWSLPDAS